MFWFLLTLSLVFVYLGVIYLKDAYSLFISKNFSILEAKGIEIDDKQIPVLAKYYAIRLFIQGAWFVSAPVLIWWLQIDLISYMAVGVGIEIFAEYSIRRVRQANKLDQ